MTSPATNRTDTPPIREGRPWARTALAGLLLAMAAGQASDLGGFTRILATYRVFPGPLPTIGAWAFVALETAAGMALLRRARCGVALSVTVAVAWTILGAQALGRGLVLHNCGCFGVHLGQPLRWWVLVQDAEFIGLAAWVRRAERRPGGPSTTSQPDQVEPCQARALVVARRIR